MAVEWARQQVVQKQACPASSCRRVSVQSSQRGQGAGTGESGYITDGFPQERDGCVVVAGLPKRLGGAGHRDETAGYLDRRGGEAGYVTGEGLRKILGASPDEAGAQYAGRVVQQQLAGDRDRCHPFEGRYNIGDGVVVEEQQGDLPVVAGAVDVLAAVDREVAGECCDLAAEPAADGELGGVRQGKRRGLCGVRSVGEDALVDVTHTLDDRARRAEDLVEQALLEVAGVLHFVQEDEGKAVGDSRSELGVMKEVVLGEGKHVVVAEDASLGEHLFERGELLATVAGRFEGRGAIRARCDQVSGVADVAGLGDECGAVRAVPECGVEFPVLGVAFEQPEGFVRVSVVVDGLDFNAPGP
ncbi:hypothetical protein OHB00_15420 [Streptomyces sp. NBC_00631]